MIDFMKLQHGCEIRGFATEGPAEGMPGEEVNLTEEVAGAIAGSFAYWLGFKVGKNPYDLRICVGQDSRLSGDVLKEGLLKGITMFGAEPCDAGLTTTSAMFMSTVLPQLDFDGAIMITAGHLPANRNGFRFFTKEGVVERDDVARILKTASRYNFVGEFYEENRMNVLPIYAAYLRQMISQGLSTVPGGMNGLHVVVDAGNGTGGFFAADVLAPMGADISGSQFLEPDGSFPNHEPDPGKQEAMDSLCKAVVDNGADIGVIFEADGCRMAVAGPDGKPIKGNRLVALAAALAAEDYPGGVVVTDSITSRELHDFIEGKLGLKHVAYRRGFRSIVEKAKDMNDEAENGDPFAFLAADTVGHVAFADNFYLDDGAFLAVQIIVNAARLKGEGKDIYSLIDGLGEPSESEEFRLRLKDEEPGALGTRILEAFERFVRESSGLELETPGFEGVKAGFRVPVAAGCDGGGGEAAEAKGKTAEAKGWLLLRKGFHESALTLNIESDAEGGVKAVLPGIFEFLGKYEGVELPE